MHWAKECKSKFDIEGKTIQGNSKQETPRSPSTKTRGKYHLFPQTLNIRQCCGWYTSPKWRYLLDFLGHCPHKLLVFYLANLVWLNRQEGQGSPNGENRLQVSDIFISLKREEETNKWYFFFFFPSLYKFKRFLLKYCVAIITPGFTGRLFSNPDLTNAFFLQKCLS